MVVGAASVLVSDQSVAMVADASATTSLITSAEPTSTATSSGVSKVGI